MSAYDVTGATATVREFLDKTVADAHANGYVTTLYARRRELPAINSRNYMQRSFAERMAMNTPIQGTAADLIKIAMIRAHDALHAAGVKSPSRELASPLVR